MAKVEVVGLVLAAGDGVRMGGSKARLELDGQTLVAAHAARLLEAGAARVVAVMRGDVLGTVGVLAKTRLVASDAQDQAGSLALAIHEDRGPKDEILIITPVDAAPVGTQTIAKLVEAVTRGALAATPRYEKRSGHPIACRRSVLSAYRGAPPYPPLRDVLRALGEERAVVEVQDPRIVVDLDTPEDVVAHTGQPPRFVGPER